MGMSIDELKAYCIKQLPSVDIKRGEDINVPTINEVEADDCVSRKNILESLNGAFPSTDWNKALFRKIVLDTPTVYPKSDKPSGKWTYDGHHLRCSNCNDYHAIKDSDWNLIASNYCPNCGSLMVEEQGETE